MRYKVKAQAKADLEAIADYIVRGNPDRAISFVEELAARFRIIAERPLSFPARDDLRPGVRSALHGNYLILFRVDGDVVHILRVVHGARDLWAVLAGDED